MRQDILNWSHKSGDRFLNLFLELFKTAPVSDAEFLHIIKNSSDNIKKDKETYHNPTRKCLNSIYNKDKFVEQDLTKIDNDFLNNKKVSFKKFLARMEKYPMSWETFNRLIKSSNTIKHYDKSKQNLIKLSQDIMNIANRLHKKDKYIKQEKHYFSAKKIQSDLEEQIIKSKNDNASTRKSRLKEAIKNPEQIKILSVGFKRNPDVVVEVLKRAKGVCEKCNKNAPFVRKTDNSPYLEVHHKIMLSDGGEDTTKNAIAVCPNCHRELHFGILLV